MKYKSLKTNLVCCKTNIFPSFAVCLLAVNWFRHKLLTVLMGLGDHKIRCVALFYDLRIAGRKSQS